MRVIETLAATGGSAVKLSLPLAWNDDVLLLPVDELPDEVRAKIDCSPDDFALSRPQARSGAKILDAAAADLVGRFREPRTLVEAVILYGRSRGLDPQEVLEGAFPLISGLVEGGFLVPASDGAVPPASRGLDSRWQGGEKLAAGRVARVLQVLEDTEVYLLQRPDAPLSVLKIERPNPSGRQPSGVRERLGHEARYLAELGGRSAPRLFRLGEIEGRAYLELERIDGIDAVAAAAEWRERSGTEGRRRLASLLREIAGSYAALHARGVLHGDVHPSNVLVGRNGGVRLLDFGLAAPVAGNGLLPATRERGGNPFFYEPELASAQLAGTPVPPASAAGEQYAVAALLYLLAAGAQRRDFSLGREAMLREIAETDPLPFRERGARAWPELETVLRRALAREPAERYPSLAAFAAAIAAATAVETAAATAVETLAATGSDEAAGRSEPAPERRATPALDHLVQRTLAAADLDGPWLREGLGQAPLASINYGAAGLGLGLLWMSLARGDGRLLALADLWTRRAAREIGRDEGFYNPEIELGREVVGESSPYHTESGIHAVAALVARAQGDPFAQAEAVERFLAASERPTGGLDLTLGRAGTLMGAALLLDALPEGVFDPAPLLAQGDATLADLWRALDAKPPIAEADVDYLGIAHGWAGFLYANLLWCRTAGREIPAGVERRLDELAALAVPSGRGLQWPWTLKERARGGAMPGWCNGACGYVFLWTLAHRTFGRREHLDLALGAAFEAFDAPDVHGSLCCGIAGRGYALLNLHRTTGDRVWLDRARDLAERAAGAGRGDERYPHSLWKGELGLATLALDLEQPERAAMPFFEPLGYRTAQVA
jgi:serine/threonine-protein kinase